MSVGVAAATAAALAPTAAAEGEEDEAEEVNRRDGGFETPAAFRSRIIADGPTMRLRR